MYIILRSFETGLRETFGLIARPLPCGPDRHRTLTYFLGQTNEKGDLCLLCDFASFFSNYVGLPIFQNFRRDFFYPIFYQFNPRFGIFWGDETHVSDFFCMSKIHPFGRHIPLL